MPSTTCLACACVCSVALLLLYSNSQERCKGKTYGMNTTFAEDNLLPIHCKACSVQAVEDTTPGIHSLNHNFLCCAGVPGSGHLLRKCHLQQKHRLQQTQLVTKLKCLHKVMAKQNHTDKGPACCCSISTLPENCSPLFSAAY